MSCLFTEKTAEVVFYNPGGDVLESLPNSTWSLIESHSNLTPRGLEVPVISSEPLRDVNRVVPYKVANNGQLYYPGFRTFKFRPQTR